MKLEVTDIKELLAQFDESGISELKLESEDVKLVLKKEGKAGCGAGTSAQRAPVWPGPMGSPYPVPGQQNASFAWPTPGSTGPMSGAPYTGVGTAPAAEAEPAPQAETEAEEERKTSASAVTAPLAGIFYRAPKPGEDPFVEVGSKVKKGDTVGLIEAMKIINEIPAPCDGTVTDILIEDGEFAQFGAELLSID